MAKEPIITNVLAALEGLSYDELIKVAETASKMAEGKKVEAKAALVAEFLERAQSLGLKLVEEGPGRGRRGPRKASGTAPAARPIKYRDSAGNSWQGVGPRPAWLKDALDKGATLDDFKV